MGGGAFYPDVAALEVLVLPDRNDLFDAFDGIAARCKRVSSMRRRCRDGNTRFADLEPANPMMDRECRGRPMAADFVDDTGERPLGERLIRFVNEMLNAPALIVIAHKTEKGRDRTRFIGPDQPHECRHIEHVGRDACECHGCGSLSPRCRRRSNSWNFPPEMTERTMTGAKIDSVLYRTRDIFPRVARRALQAVSERKA